MSEGKAPRVVDAYLYPRKVVEGCQHRLGCKCDPPFWLRMPSPSEMGRMRSTPEKPR